MAKNNTLWWVVFIVLALVVGYLIGTTITGNLTRESNPIDGSYGGSSSTIKANSCDADSVCEVNSIASPGSLTITPASGYSKLHGQLTLAKVGASGGSILETDDLGKLTITPGGQLVSVIGTFKSDYVTTNVVKGIDVLQLTSGNDKVSVAGTLTVTGLNQNATSPIPIGEKAYVCVDSVGLIYRSLTACR